MLGLETIISRDRRDAVPNIIYRVPSATAKLSDGGQSQQHGEESRALLAHTCLRHSSTIVAPTQHDQVLLRYTALCRTHPVHRRTCSAL
jgi:hypothetical protein